jgi:hypothetical protein
MPGKMARSDPRPSFGLPELLVAIHTSRQSCCKGGKTRIFTPVRESSGESRLNGSWVPRTAWLAGAAACCPPGNKVFNSVAA